MSRTYGDDPAVGEDREVADGFRCRGPDLAVVVECRVQRTGGVQLRQHEPAPYPIRPAQAAEPDTEPRLLSPEQVQVPPGWVLAGNVFSAYGDRLPGAAARHEALPGAEAMLRLAPELLAAGRAVAPAQAWPVYVRDKVAQTTQERAALTAAQAPPSS